LNQHQKDENRTQSADSLKAYSKSKAFNGHLLLKTSLETTNTSLNPKQRKFL